MSEEKTQIRVFEEQKVRTIWNAEEEEWYFSVVDVVAVLTNSANPNNYWKVLKNRLKKEGSQLVTICNQLKLPAADGKNYKTDCLDTEGIFRLIQSIPSPKAEPFKMWMAQVAKERLDEMQDPEQGIYRALAEYKGFKKENLRDNMTNQELVLNMLAEMATTDISKARNPQSFSEHEDTARRGGNIAKEARERLELETGKKIVSPLNAKDYFEQQQIEDKNTKTE